MKRFCPLILLILGAGLGAVQIAVAQEAPEDPPGPFHRTELSCAEMRQHPAQVFAEDIDLGSGMYSMVEVEFDCPGGLGSLPFLRRLARLADAVRGEQDRDCGGTLIYAQRRYHDFELLKAGFAPALFQREAEAVQARKEGPEDRSDDLYPNQLRYFAVWSHESFSNFRLHRAFLAEYDRALPRLAAHYRRKFHFSAVRSRAVARHGLMIFVKWAAGVFPEDVLVAAPRLVQLSATPGSTLAELRGALAATPPPGQETIDQAFKIALLHGKPRPYLALLAEKLTTLEKGNEPATFFALGDADSVRWLLDRGARVDAANSFGKTPLFYAIEMGDRRLATLLLEHGADVNHRYKKAAELAPDADFFGCGEHHFIHHPERTPLMHAAQHADLAMLKLLLARGARLEGVDGMGFNALDYARMGNRPANAAFLAALGLRPHQDPAGVPAT
jgi:hypothetical protein